MSVRPAARLLAALLLAALTHVEVSAQAVSAAAQAAPAPATAAPATPIDALGRSTPRGTVLGFLAASRKEDAELARQYLNTRLTGVQAQELARQLFVVLDTRLPARLTQVSDAPEGSRANPLAPGQEVIGTIEDRGGTVQVVLERSTPRGQSEAIWLFSSKTLDAITDLYDAIVQRQAHSLLPRFLTHTRVSGIPLFEWLALLVGLPAIYVITGLLNRLLKPLVRLSWTRVLRNPDPFNRDPMPAPARLLLLAIGTHWLLSVLPLSLLLRQFWSSAATVLTIVSIAWLLVIVNGDVETLLVRRLNPVSSASVSLLRVARRGVDLLVIFGGLLALLRHFSVDPTPALAGLGVGGIAVALAAQKTLENVIAGASLIFDQAVRIGDYMKVGDLEGTVEHIGLRSTRIRTLNRTIVTIPNSQIANMSLETFSARDKFWFHPVVGLRYETTEDQMGLALRGLRDLLERHDRVDRPSVRVRFLRLGAFSLDVELFAYVHARDWAHFLEIQEGLLLGITSVIHAAGTDIAFPTQTMHMVNSVNSQLHNAQLPINSQYPIPNSQLSNSEVEKA